jgi:hypothetical protein
MSDQYPIQGRARIFAMYAMATLGGPADRSVHRGRHADFAGGTEGWRWVYISDRRPPRPAAIAAGCSS